MLCICTLQQYPVHTILFSYYILLSGRPTPQGRRLVRRSLDAPWPAAGYKIFSAACGSGSWTQNSKVFLSTWITYSPGPATNLDH